jgi:hypothetical protein
MKINLAYRPISKNAQSLKSNLENWEKYEKRVVSCARYGPMWADSIQIITAKYSCYIE